MINTVKNNSVITTAILLPIILVLLNSSKMICMCLACMKSFRSKKYTSFR